MKKLLDFDCLRAVQLKCNTSPKSVIPVQKAQYQCKLQIKILEADLESIGVRDWNSIKNCHKPPITFEKFSEGFRNF